jgi:NADH-quinone oxidoreductase subunit J
VLALPLGAALVLLLLAVLARRGAGPAAAAPADQGLTALVRLLFTDYLFAFELTSVLLLAAMVGVLVLARRRT